MQNLSNELAPVADWHLLGVKFGIEDPDLREIEESFLGSKRRKEEVISRWLCSSTDHSWNDVVNVLCLMEEHVVADRIRRKYIIGQYDHQCYVT